MYKYQHYLNKYEQVVNHHSHWKEEQRPRVLKNKVLRAFADKQEDGGEGGALHNKEPHNLYTKYYHGNEISDKWIG